MTYTNDLEKQMTNIFINYKDELNKILQDEISKGSEEARGMVEQGSPARKNGRSVEPAYRSGWKVKTKSKKDSIEATVRNENKPGLVHLLEFGHICRDGSRTRAIPLVLNVADQKEEEILQNIIERIEKLK